MRLQAGDAENLAIWKEMIRLSQVQFDTLYGRMGTRFDHTLGESFYNPELAPVVEALWLQALPDPATEPLRSSVTGRCRRRTIRSW